MAYTFISSSSAESTADSTTETAVAPDRAVGDALFAVVTTVTATPATSITATGWTVEDSDYGSHSRVVFSRTATDDAADDLVAVVDQTGAVGIVMCAYRGVDPTAWVVSAQGWESDSATPYLAPFSLGTFDIGTTPGAFIAMFSAQMAGTVADDGVVSIGAGGSLRVQAASERTSFNGGISAICDALNVTGNQAITITYAGTPTVSAFSTMYFYNITPAVTIPTQGPFTPVIANARMDALSAARNFTAPPIDISMDQSFLLDPLEVLDPDVITGFDEIMSPGTVEFYYTPLGRQSQQFLQEFTGETTLARMGRTFPPAIMTLASDITESIIADNIDADGNVDARYIIAYVFSQWAVQYPWFNYVTPIPDLRMPIVGVANDEYTAGMGVVESPVIFISQTEDNERTMLDILQQLLAPFGAFKTMNDNNELVIRARYGPDADTTAVVTLKDNDVYNLSVGDPSRVGTKNRIVLTKRLFDKAADTPVMQDAYWQIRSDEFDATLMPTDRVSDPPEAIPGTRLDLTDGIGSSRVGYGRYDPLFWPASTSVVGEDTILWTSSPAASPPSTVQLDVDFTAYLLGAPATTLSKSLSDAEVTLQGLTDLPMDGAWHEIFKAQYENAFLGIPNGKFFSVTLEGMWVNDPSGRGIRLRISDIDLHEFGLWVGPTFFFGDFVGSFAISLSDASVAWSDRGTSTTVTTAAYEDGELTLEAPDGTNAVQNSIEARGILEERIDIGVYNPSLEQMQDMAAGLLLDKIQPRAIRIAEQSVVRAHPIRFAHVGRVIALPDAELGVVTSRSYSESAGSVGRNGALSSVIEVMTPISGASGEVDLTLQFILQESGGNLALDQGGGSLLIE